MADIEDRFWAKVSPGDCWEWTAGLSARGYGVFHPHSSTTVLAHRWAYESLVGFIPVGLHLDHLCRNRRCVNPDHLEPVRSGENTRRGYRSNVRHCIKGHAYTPENTYTSPRGERRCRECSRELDRQPHRNAALRRARKAA